MNARTRVLTSVVAAVTLGCAKGDAIRSPTVGSAAPEYAAVSLEGQPVSLASLRGKVVVLNAWATWCEPCKDVIPQIEALPPEFAGKDFALIGISVDAAGMGADVREINVGPQDDLRRLAGSNQAIFRNVSDRWGTRNLPR
ncbi:MAG: TlpA disulfide reductase family protein [Gemmatimonadota bacterium]